MWISKFWGIQIIGSHSNTKIHYEVKCIYTVEYRVDITYLIKTLCKDS